VVGADGQQSPAEIRWLAPDGIDVALLRTGALSGLEVVELRARAAKVGDPIFVVGNPMGLSSSYTAGTVSALRAIPAGGRSVHVLQIQASVNQGNSGGGLYSSEGDLLGLVTWTADKRLAEGIGFAIAGSDIVEMLEASGAPWKELAAARAPARVDP
jgi:S1-C subfamily serine protease